MKPKRSAAEVMFLTAAPAVFLLGSILLLIFSESLFLPAYLIGCVAGMLALAGCLVWGAGLCERMVRALARGGMIVVTALLAAGALLCFLLLLVSGSSKMEELLFLLGALPLALLPAVLHLTFLGAVRSTEKQKPDVLFWILLGIGALGMVASAVCMILAMPLTRNLVWFTEWFVVLGSAAVIALFLVRRWSIHAVPVLICLVLGLAAEILMLLELMPLHWQQLAYTLPLHILAICEAAVCGGLIPDGRVWPALLERSTFPLQLMDIDGNLVYGSDIAMPVASNHKAAILNNRYHVSQILEHDFQLSAAVIRGGYALQQKDLRDLHALQDTLQKVLKELEETNGLLSRESEIKSDLVRLTKKNAFFAEQEAKIREKTDRAALLLRCAAAASPEPGFRRAVVTRANLLVTYTQQLGLLLKAARETDILPVYHLRDALEASAKAATAAGARCRVYHVAQGAFPSDVILSLYDLNELVLEDILSGTPSTLEIRLRNEQNGLRLILTVKDTTISSISSRVEHIIAQTAAMGGEARFNVEGDDVSIFIEFLKGGAEHA